MSGVEVWELLHRGETLAADPTVSKAEPKPLTAFTVTISAVVLIRWTLSWQYRT